ncbi:MAG: glycosyltransferase family 2 protein [Elusimicrobia bacterium]|nr:glycosyltransferase family 2 protein [Elusimicrobiota bacterium]
MGRRLISIVTPCFNEEANVAEHLRRVRAAAAPFKGEFDFEHIYTDNCSSDRTFELLRGLGAEDPAVKALRFSRNIGANRAIAMGLGRAKGDAVVLIQADLQDPPELIADFIAGWKEGWDVVYGRIERREEGVLGQALRRLYYRLIARLSDAPVHLDAGEFRLASRRALDAMLSSAEDDLYLRGMAAAVGFKQKAIPYRRAARAGGTSSQGPFDLLRYAANGLLSTSTAPIRMVTLAGFWLAALGFLLTAVLVASKFLLPGQAPRGITMLATLIAFFSGAQLFAIGIIGEYIRKIFVQTLRVPRGFVADTVNLP